jgi:hypothetical protein
MATVQEKAMCVLWFYEINSVIKMQHRYRTQYGKDPLSDNAIRRWIKQFQEIGSVVHRRPRTLQEVLIESGKCFLKANKNHQDELIYS